MAVHNGAGDLEATLDSIVSQEGPPLELIAVDDASTDATGAILARYASQDARVRLLRNAENRGLTASLIRGCDAARARRIARNEAGDLSLPGRLARQAAVLEADPGVVLVSCWTELVGPYLEPLYVTRGTEAAAREAIGIVDLGSKSGVIDGPTHHGSAMFRASTYREVGGYRAAFYYSQDWDLWFRLAERGTFRIVPEVLYRARLTPGSISSAARERQHALGALAVEALAARQQGRDDAEIVARAAAIRLYFIGEALRRNGDARARRYLRDAVRAQPWLARAWWRWLQSLVTTRWL
jgi:glycosyltransferase involved in cell wall biosynthesis